MYNNKAACACSKCDDQDDEIIDTLAFVNFLLINFSNPDLSKFSPSKFMPYGNVKNYTGKLLL